MFDKVLITGGSGLFGINFILQNKNVLKITSHENNKKVTLPKINKANFVINDVSSINTVIKSLLPDFIIHAAGMTSVEACEDDPDKANFVNGTLAGNMSKVAFDLGIKFVYISTDHLFDGNQSFVSEEAPLKPINSYGYSKALGEDLTLKNNPDSLIIRSNFFGWGPHYRRSFSDLIIDSLKNKVPVFLFKDVFFTPIYLGSLIKVLKQLVEKQMSGIFNVVSCERISKYDFGLKIADYFQLDKQLVRESKISERMDLVKRPHDLSLANEKVKKIVGNKLGSVHEELSSLLIDQTSGLKCNINKVNIKHYFEI